MVFAFLAIWAFGAVLLLTCSALTWSERLSILRSVPTCARCGYDLTGLSWTASCPECAGIDRRFKAREKEAAQSKPSVMLWTGPISIGLIASAVLSAMAHIPSPGNIFGPILNAAAFLAVSILLRILLHWITLAAAETMMWCCIVCMTLALGAVILYAMIGHDLNATPEQVLLMGPALTFPFAGYGLAGGISLLAFWQRHRPLSRPRADADPPMRQVQPWRLKK